ncbi:MAG: hypothetical protein ACTSUE_15230, partial [Promethearchaeota archaeon]
MILKDLKKKAIRKPHLKKKRRMSKREGAFGTYVICEDGTMWEPSGNHPGDFAPVYNSSEPHRNSHYQHNHPRYQDPRSHPGEGMPQRYHGHGRASRHPGSIHDHNSRIGRDSSSRGFTGHRRPGASRIPSERIKRPPKKSAPVVQSSTMITKSSQKRKTHGELLKQNPGILCIDNAFPTEHAFTTMIKILKYHESNPMDGKPPSSNHIVFAWLPNASWVGETLSGYVFSVDGSKKSGDDTSRSRMMVPSTPVVPDMFPREKMLYGMLCIRLPNTKTNSLGLKPIDCLELYSEKDMDVMLRDLINDDTDLSVDGSYAGFYISEDPTREWERTVWVVISTGDRDISHTIHEYLKGDYNPYTSNNNNKKSLKEIAEEMKTTLDRVKAAATKSKGTSSDTAKHDELCGEDEFVDDMVFSHLSTTKSTQSKTKKGRKKTKKKATARGKKLRGKKSPKKEEEEEEEEENKAPKSTTERLEEVQLPEEERCAWKYSKLIKEIHRLIQAHAKNAASDYGGSQEFVLGGYKGEPECVKHRAMTWETNLMKESFIDGMLLRMKEKRWLVASKLISILGFDLIQDFQIDPFDKNIDNHRDVIHVTINTFVQNKRTAKMVYYSGAYCKHEMKGALPVPVSPLEGIHILKGPPKTDSSILSKTISTTNASWSSNHCISDNRFRMVVSSKTDSIGDKNTLGRPEGRFLSQSQQRKSSKKSSFMGSSDSDSEEEETSTSSYE